MSPLMIPMLALSIPLFGMIFAGWKRWIDLKEKQLEQTSALTAEKTAQYAAQTERLEDRVRVLERIMTDRGITVAAEIEALRDERPRQLTQD
jgi:hypothetical protein